MFSLHIIKWASLVIFASVLRFDSQSFGPVYSFILFGLFARPSFSSNLANCLASIFLVLLAFFQFAVLLSLSFVVILSSLCIYLIFVLQYRFSLFQIACHRFVSVVERLDSIKLFVRKIKACKGRHFTSLLEPLANNAWILYYHQYMWFLAPDAIIMIVATVWAIACVRRNPDTFSRELRTVTRSIHDFKKTVIYSEHRQKQIKFRYR